MLEWISVKDQPAPRNEIFVGKVEGKEEPVFFKMVRGFNEDHPDLLCEMACFIEKHEKGRHITHWYPLPKPLA